MGNEGGAGPWKCVANVGYSPTFAGQENAEKIVEGHLIGYKGAVMLVLLLVLLLRRLDVYPPSIANRASLVLDHIQNCDSFSEGRDRL